MAEDIVIDLDTLTIGELEEGERIAGESFRMALEGKGTSMAALVALLFIVKRKVDPAVTLQDVRNMPLSGIPKVRIKQESKGRSRNPTSAAAGASSRSA